MRLRGLYTALVTPFTANGDIDLPAFRNLVRDQVAAGVQGVVVTGSTGEAATLSTEEKYVLWDAAVQEAQGRIPVIAGSGSNNTAESVKASQRAAQAGVAALLVVTPYYNKPVTSGLVAHYDAIAQAVNLPQIIYNVPGRTATNMLAETQLAIFDAIPLVVATKEASANLGQIATIAAQAPSHVQVLAGDDDLALPTIAVGGSGVIAVISNYAPRTFGALVKAALDCDLAAAQRIHATLLPWYRLNFLESNPIPVKYIMHKLTGIELTYRLPLSAPSPATCRAIDEQLVVRPD